MIPYFQNDDHWNAFYKEILEWLGTPYRHLGNFKGRGADCTLFIGSVALNVGIFKKIDFDYYSRDWHIHGGEANIVVDSYLANEKNMAEGLSMETIGGVANPYMRGDIFMMSVMPSKVIHHAGICIDKKTMIHCIGPRGVQECRFEGWWQRRVIKTVRLMESE